ncbi:MAG TPA: hypothetical protein VNY10_07995 [Roseiarcus sp.]|nr:hypothetical protein [Roseiarcus sp.]
MDRHAGARGAERDRGRNVRRNPRHQREVGEAARASQPAAARPEAIALPWFAAEDIVIFRARSIVAIPGRCGVEREIYDEADAG